MRLTHTNSLRATSSVQWRTMHVCRSAAKKRKQRRHREVQSSGCCSHGTGKRREREGEGEGEGGRVSCRIVYSKWDLAGGGISSFAPHVFGSFFPSFLDKNVSASLTFQKWTFFPLVGSLPFPLLSHFFCSCCLYKTHERIPLSSVIKGTVQPQIKNTYFSSYL